MAPAPEATGGVAVTGKFHFADEQRLRGDVEEANTHNDDRHQFRLFVSCIPLTSNEAQLRVLFSQFGQVEGIVISKETSSEQSHGFVMYASKEEAELAISELDQQVYLPGALLPLKVRFARNHKYVAPGTGSQDNRQLFFSQASRTATQDQLQAIFSQFGEVEQVQLFKDAQGRSKGSGFVRMQTREQAIRAIGELHGRHTTMGSTTPLSVSWADLDLQKKKKAMMEASPPELRTVFFANVPATCSEAQVKSVFSRFGQVNEVTLFRAYPGAPACKGLGLVTMDVHAAAMSAIQGLNQQYTWPGLDNPMTATWMDKTLQSWWRQRHQHHPTVYHLPVAAAPPFSCAMGLAGPVLQTKIERPPAGCSPDAIRLFIGNIPKTCTVEDLLPVVASVGKVVELVIVTDRETGLSKGSAFVWYASRQSADRAIAEFNVRFGLLPDRDNEQDRPLVVRQARCKMQPAKLPPVCAAVCISPMPPCSGLSVRTSFLRPSAASGVHLEQGPATASVAWGDDLDAASEHSYISTCDTSISKQSLAAALFSESSCTCSEAAVQEIGSSSSSICSLPSCSSFSTPSCNSYSAASSSTCSVASKYDFGSVELASPSSVFHIPSAAVPISTSCVYRPVAQTSAHSVC